MLYRFTAMMAFFWRLCGRSAIYFLIFVYCSMLYIKLICQIYILSGNH